MNASVPIEANGIIPVAQSDVAGIPPIALSIPDFEGQAILRIFANSTETEIGCYSAVVTNGATFSHPAAVGSVLGVFTVVAVIASFMTAIYGTHIPTVRKHYAHSLSVLVVFSVFHHIFFTGALSVNWPSVLPAFWSNFAWSAGMIYSETMQNSINQLIGSNKGNTSMVGAASSGSALNDLGGGFSIQQIYKRSVYSLFHRDMTIPSHVEDMLKSKRVAHALAKRSLANTTSGYSWYGSPVKPGLPLPGNFSGFAGTLAEEDIPASNAFMTGFLWLLILVALVVVCIVGLKWLLEGLSRIKVVKTERLGNFRTHWLGFTALAVLRIMLISFFMMIFLTLFQFTYRLSAGVTAISAIVFIVFLAGILTLAGYACYYRLRFGRYASEPDRLNIERRKVLKVIPRYGFVRESQKQEEKHAHKVFGGSLPWWRIHYIDHDSNRLHVHEDEDYLQKFGWLAARFRRTKWWFFAVWIVYEFVRACFYGGAAGYPMTQVFGLLVVEFIAWIATMIMKPFEGARLNALMVYLLGFSKVATLALSAAFDARFNLGRITTTAIGIVLIVIQGILVIVLLIAIVVGAVTSYMSVTRNHEEFKPHSWAGMRQKYFQHIEQKAMDLPPPPPPKPEEPKEPYFAVSAVRRWPKIEDEDEVFVADINDPHASRVSMNGVGRTSRANSMRSQMSTSVPFGARVHRASWSSRDFNSWHESDARTSEAMRSSNMQAMKSDTSLRDSAPRSRAPSRSGAMDVAKSRILKEKEPAAMGITEEEQRIGSAA
ncbi:hypothetical protein MMC16_002824 [Acarospora aff. strigata]|nr:hypothetical protein [Acarospora aff. strigata]